MSVCVCVCVCLFVCVCANPCFFTLGKNKSVGTVNLEPRQLHRRAAELSLNETGCVSSQWPESNHREALPVSTGNNREDETERWRDKDEQSMSSGSVAQLVTGCSTQTHKGNVSPLGRKDRTKREHVLLLEDFTGSQITNP